LGGYISTQVAIENKEMIEKLVLIGSAGFLKEPTQWLRAYLNAAMELNPVTRYEKVKRYLRTYMPVLQGCFMCLLIFLIM
jgi:pimeloyl-ACP methyl ester carboxylesterase